VAAFDTIARRGGGWLPLIGATALTGTATSLALPTVLGHAVDDIVAGGATGSQSGGQSGGRWLAWAAGLIALNIVVNLIDAYAATICVADVTVWLRQRLITHLLAVGPRASTRFDTGDLVSRVTGNAADAAAAGLSVVTVGTAMVPPIGSLVLLTLIDWWVAVAFLGGVALVALVLAAFTRRTSDVVSRYQHAQGRLAARLTESLAGARTIAAAATAEQEERRVLAPLPQLQEYGAQTWRVLSRAGGQAAIVGPLVQVVVLAAGGMALVRGRISAGELFAAGQYASLGAGLGGLTGVLGRLARAKAGVRRADEVLTEPILGYGRYSLPNGRGTLELRGVTVRGATVRGATSSSAGAPVLDAVHLTVPGGAEVALVGPTGAGKSVLAAVAARLLDPDDGVVLLDGVPLRELHHDALRAAIGVAFERPVLLGRTVGEAISSGRDSRLVLPAATATRAHDFVSRLPDGYYTALADAPMSGGEAQRLGLARAWPAGRMLVLDDATSSLDMVTEMQISRALTQYHGRRTRLIVTHRAAMAARADLVVWLVRGRIRATGTHQRLWEDPEYRAVFQ
jgi:ATP-binding cassette subfamily B protein